jgi:hypothetical protein
MEKKNETREAGSDGASKDRMIPPLNVQLDPGLRDWHHYQMKWDTNENVPFAEIIATRVAGQGYNAGKEYWLVDKTKLPAPDGLFPDVLIVSSLGDKDWGTDATPSPPTHAQEFVCNTDATWQEVGNDLTADELYQYTNQDTNQVYYVRIVTTGTPPNATITTLRWYQKNATQPPGTFNPGGNYTKATSGLGSGTVWYADSKSP